MMNRVKEFVKRHKGIFIAGGVIVGGVLTYAVTRKPPCFNGQLRIKEQLESDDGIHIFKTFEEAMEQFKESQKTNNVVGMFLEKNQYEVLELEKK